jgi:hypothetical protein
MYFRCLECQASSGVAALSKGQLACQSCGRSYPIERGRELTPDSHQEAVSLTRSGGIDLPCAYSVVLGIMTLDQAQRISELAARAAAPVRRRTRVETPDDTENADDPTEVRYLTKNEEVGRGVARALHAVRLAETVNQLNRAAEDLAKQHGLPQHIARMVVDNRMSIDEALHAQQQALPRPRLRDRLRPSNASAAQIFMLTAATLLIVFSIGRNAWQRQVIASKERVVRPSVSTRTAPSQLVTEEAPDPKQPVRVNLGGTDVTRNEYGQVLQVSGPDPRTVLLAYCGVDLPTPNCEPNALTDTVPRFSGARLGLFRRDGTLYAVRIRRESGRDWVVGDGEEPVQWSDLADVRVGDRRVGFRRTTDTQ